MTLLEDLWENRKIGSRRRETRMVRFMGSMRIGETEISVNGTVV